MAISPLEELERWYLANCDGDWEHSNGIQIETLDNPGWAIKISLQGTPWANIRLDPVVVDRNENDWINCKIVNEVFLGRCGPRNLHEVLELFQRTIAPFEK